MDTTQTSVTKPEEKGIRALLSWENARQRIEPFLMPGADYNRVMAGAHYAARQNPQILECTHHSIIDAVARIQQWQLEIGTTAHLVPFNVKASKRGEPDKWVKVCTPIADYKGLAELMVRSGAVRHVEARVVYKGDKFTYRYGIDAMVEHVPVHAAKERGEIIAAYVILRLPFGQSSFEVMLIEDIEEIRSSSKQWNPDRIKKCPAWYAKKTVVRQAAKLVPKDPRFAQAMSIIADEEADELDTHSIAAEPKVQALSAGRPEEEIYDTVRANEQRALRNIPTVEYMPEAGTASLQRMSAEEIAEIASRPDPYETPSHATHQDDPNFADSFPEDELPLGDALQTGRQDAVRDGGR